MRAPKIRVANGRIQIDEPTDLPNGTELFVVPAEQLEGTYVNDDLDEEERAELHASIEEAERELAAGQVVSEEQLWARLRAMP